MKGEIVREPKERIDAKTGRRWIQDHETAYDRRIKEYLETSKSPNKRLIGDYLQDMRLGDRNKLSARKSISKSRCLRVLGVLQNVDVWLKYTPFQEVSVENMKDFALDLKEDGVKFRQLKELKDLRDSVF